MPEPLISINVDDREITESLKRLGAKFSDAQVAIGTNVQYMVDHQVGKGQIQRKFLGISEEDKKEILLIVNEFAQDDRQVDMRDLMKNIGEAMVLSTDQRWEQEIDPDGIPWAPNSPWIRAKKRAEGRIDKILQYTGRGRASINYQVY
jgi:phage gpG-like protein